MSSADDARRNYVTPKEGSPSLTQAGAPKEDIGFKSPYGMEEESSPTIPNYEAKMEAKGRRRIFVAGATGYLGRFVVREALARGYAVRALTRDGARLPPELAEIPRGGEGAAFEVAEGEATRPETLRGLTRDCDVLFSSIGVTRQRDAGVKYMDVDYGANRDRSVVVIPRFQMSFPRP